MYQLLGTSGLPVSSVPAAGQPVHGQLGHHLRAGEHDIKWEDWQQYLAFADRQFGKTKR